ncbi:hypothetical protein [Viridibacillus arvi]|uniref:hypothetical protein n=1 Tax=Viridibacillus arvi TaxID=263475 RepID=UPI0034CD58DF
MSNIRNIKRDFINKRNELINEQNVIVIANCNDCKAVKGKVIAERIDICATCKVSKKLNKIGKQLEKNSEMKRAEVWNIRKQTTGSACRRACN